MQSDRDEYDDVFQPDEESLRMLESAFLGGNQQRRGKVAEGIGLDEYDDPMFDEAVEELEKMESQQQTSIVKDAEMIDSRVSESRSQSVEDVQLLLSEKQELQRVVYAKAGEVTIVRDKLKSTSESHKMEIDALHSKHKDALDRANDDYAKLKGEFEVLKTDKAFRDFDREVGNNSRAVVVNGGGGGKQYQQPNLLVTPTKAKRRSEPVYDFESIDLRMSPSRGAKKVKRLEQKSMVKQDGTAPKHITEHPSAFIISILQAAKENAHENCFIFLQNLINYAPDDTSVISRLASLSNKDKKPLDQAILSDVLRANESIVTLTSLLLTTLNALTKCWSQCLQEKLIAAIPYIQTLLYFCIPYYPLQMESLLQQDWLLNLISLCESSIESHTSLRIKGLISEADANNAPEIALNSINILQILCEQGLEEDDNRKLCLRLRGDILLMACNSKQSSRIITAALSFLLSTCGVSGFGPLNEERAAGSCNPNIILELVSRHLMTPPSGMGRQSSSFLELRLEVATLLLRITSACRDGAFHIGNTDVVLPRLSICLADVITEYTGVEPVNILYHQQVLLIRMIMAVLYYVVTTQCESSLVETLACVRGARQAHIVAMTRLGLGSEHAELFSYEASMARDLLEAAVSSQLALARTNIAD